MKDTKKKLLASIATLCVCFAMLIGSTYAWFTDSASTGVNKIQAGNLDIEAYYQNSILNPSGNDVTIDMPATFTRSDKVFFEAFNESQRLDGNVQIINEATWEPGKVGARLITVKNKGNLDAKIKLDFITTDEGLESALWFDFVMVNTDNNTTAGRFEFRPMSTLQQTADQTGSLSLPKESELRFILVYGMYESAGNQYQNKSFSAKVIISATQLNSESDSFDNQYDKDAEYPIVANTQAELNAAITSAQNGSAISTEVVLPAGDFKLENGTAQNKNITISGTADTVVTVVGDTGNQMNYQNGATLAFEGVTIQGQTAGDFGGIANVAKTTFVNCTFNGKLTLYGDATFINCTFINFNDYAIWTWGAKNAEFIRCTFNSGGKALLLYGGAGSTETPTTNLTVTDCEFNDNDTLTNADKAAIEIGNDYGAVYNLTVKNSTANGFTVNPEGFNTGSKIWANKNSMDQTHLNVVIDGVDVY